MTPATGVHRPKPAMCCPCGAPRSAASTCNRSCRWRSRHDSDRVVEANGTVVEDRGGDETSTRLGPRPYSRGLSPAQGRASVRG
ncbi:hypothetical protein ACE0DR_25825 [Azotobacter sp. CWF10]